MQVNDSFPWAMFAIPALTLFFMLRNCLSGAWCQRRIKEIHAVASGLIHARQYEAADRVQKLYAQIPQIALIFDLRVWSYERAFPEPVEP